MSIEVKKSQFANAKMQPDNEDSSPNSPGRREGINSKNSTFREPKAILSVLERDDT